nr:unnamed protein product [Digitaria exilis]
MARPSAMVERDGGRAEAVKAPPQEVKVAGGVPRVEPQKLARKAGERRMKERG